MADVPLTSSSAASTLYKWAKEVEELPPCMDGSYLSEAIIPGLADLTNHHQDFRLVIMGEFSSGKSTLVNAFIGREIARTAATIETSHLSVFRHAEEEQVIFHLKGGGAHRLALSEARKVLAEHGRRTDLIEQVDHVEFYLPDESLHGFVLVDTPGLATVIAEHEELTRKELERCHAVLWIFDADQPGSGTERDYLGQLHERFVVGLVNKTEDVEADEMDEVLDACRQTAPEVLEAVLPISAYEALEARLSGDQAKLEASGLPAAQRYLTDRIIGHEQLLRDLGDKARFKFLCQQFYAELVARRSDLQEAVRRYEDLRVLLEERHQVLADEIAEELRTANREYRASVLKTFDEEAAGLGNKEQYQQLFEKLIGQSALEQHVNRLKVVAEQRYKDFQEQTAGEINSRAQKWGQIQVVIDVNTESLEEQKARERRTYIGFTTAIPGAFAAGIAYLSLVINWPVAVAALVIGLGFGGATSGAFTWLKDQVTQNRALREAARKALQQNLSEIAPKLDTFVEEVMLGAVTDADEQAMARHLDDQRTKLLQGHPPETVLATAQRLEAVEQGVRKIAKALEIDLSGVVQIRSTAAA